MSVLYELLKDIHDFLVGEISIQRFSYDFEEKLANLAEKLREENEAIYNLFEEELPEICANYEEDAEERSAYPDYYLSESDVRQKVSKIYFEALRLLPMEQIKQAI